MPRKEKKTLIKLSSIMIMGARDEAIYKEKKILFPIASLLLFALRNDHPQRKRIQ